ncbi:papain-like cysteine peptidase, partial [Bacillus cereus]|nr:papain-like cysteine peptidase [Bacillus cereus]
VSSHIVKDIKYNITSYHDFPVISNKEWSTTYPEFKQTLDRRINNFYKIMEKSQSILFVRWGGNLIETLELQSMLSRIVRNNFKILLLSPTGAENEITTLEWGIDHVCTLQVSKNYLNKRTWYILLKDIHLNSKI